MPSRIGFRFVAVGCAILAVQLCSPHAEREAALGFTVGAPAQAGSRAARRQRRATRRRERRARRQARRAKSPKKPGARIARVWQRVKQRAARLARSVGRVVGKVVAAVKQVGRTIATFAGKAAAKLEGLVAWARDKAKLIGALVRAAKQYPVLLARLRALRAQPSPIDTGFSPAAALSPRGLADLATKAGVYEEMVLTHLDSNVMIGSADRHWRTGELLRFHGGIGDAGMHHGIYTAIRAFKYGVTGAAQDLARLRDALVGAYNILTAASAPAGKIINPRTGQQVPGRAGLPLRGFANPDSPRLKDLGDIDTKKSEVYEYRGRLFGLSGTRWRLKGDVSRDQIDGLLFGLGSAYEVLEKRNVEPQWRRRIADGVAAFVRTFVRNKYRIIGLAGKVTTYGDQAMMLEPVTLFTNLSWLRIAIRVSGAADLKQAYRKVTNRYFGRWRFLKAGIWKGLMGLVEPLVRSYREVLAYSVPSFNFQLLLLPLYMLLRHETDAKLREVYRTFVEKIFWPLVRDMRVPTYDLAYLWMTGKRDGDLLGRAAATLRQVRSPPFPLGNPVSSTELVTDFSGRKELHDPLFFYLRDLWNQKLQRHFPKNENPIFKGGSAWPLGPGLVPPENLMGGAAPYNLKGFPPHAWTWSDGRLNLRQFAGHDYLLSYWFGRYHGVLAGVAGARSGRDQSGARRPRKSCGVRSCGSGGADAPAPRIRHTPRAGAWRPTRIPGMLVYSRTIPLL